MARYNVGVETLSPQAGSQAPANNIVALELPGGRLELALGSFEWTQPRIAALPMLADGRFTAVDVGLAVGVSAGAVREWTRDPDFAAAVTALRARMLERCALNGLAVKEARVARHQDRLERIQQVVEERAAAGTSARAAEAAGVEFDALLASAPGGSSGLVVHRQRVIGSGPKAEVVDEFEVDAGLLRAEAELSRQLATELGQWTEKTETTQVRKLYIGIDLERM